MATMVKSAFLLALSLLLVSGPTVAFPASPLKFLLMVASGSSPDSSTVVPAVDQTLEEINRDTSILPGHQLEYILRDTETAIQNHSILQCILTRALDSFFDVATENSVVAVVGCGCSSATEEVAKISRYSNISVISYASTSVVLSDRSVYRSFFRTVPSDELLVTAVTTIMDSYGWRQLSVFTEEQPQFKQLNYLLRQTPQQMVSIGGMSIHPNDLKNYSQLADKISHVFDAQPHIFLPVASPRAETFILCTAYHNGRFYPNYAWILLGHHETDWWREYYMETNCSDADMMKVLNRSHVLIPYPDNNNNSNSGGQNGVQYIEQIEQGDLYNVSAYASDAVRVLAEVLHTCFNSTGSGSISGSCRGTELNWNVTFTGRTGFVNFDALNGNREATSTVIQQYQFRGNVRLLQSVGIIQKSGISTHHLTPVGNSSVWPDGIPPDGTPTVVTSNEYNIVIIYALISGLVLVAAAVCLVFNIVFRNKKIVKLTSPKLNYLLIFGVVLMAVASFVYPSSNATVVTIMCRTSGFFVSLGYDIAIGVALAKTWRVFYIFKNPSPDKKPPKDWQLLLLVLLIVIVEIVIYVPLVALHLVYNNGVLTTSSEVNEQGVMENFIGCGYSIFYSVLVVLSNGYKLLLNVIGLVLALLISNIEVDALNDSRETVAIIYTSTVVFQVYALILPNVWESSISTNALVSSTIFLIAMTHLGLTFVPKMVALHKDPQGENVFKKIRSIPLSHISSSSARSVDKDVDNGMITLRERVTQLEGKLKSYEDKATVDEEPCN